MNDKITISSELVIPNLEASSPQVAIEELGALLVRGGFASGGYVDGVLTREQSYPTGIEFPLCGVAMPHGEPEGVLGAAIAIGRCSRPVAFKRMEDFSQEINVSIIAMLAVSDPAGHLDVLGKLIGVFSDEQTCQSILSARESREIASILDEAINERG